MQKPQCHLTVDRFLAELDHPLQAEIAALRALILAADAGISERVKWNAPSFCWAGDDRVTMKLHPATRVQLVFHRGATATTDAAFRFADDSGLLRWVAPDRAVATFRVMAEIDARRAALADLVVRWMRATSNDEQ